MNEESEVAKPKWLRKLERESWQAELLISGAALYGSFQLPGLLESIQDYLLLNATDDVMVFWFLDMTYWVFFAYTLLFMLLYHFVVRALWIGLVGLNSIYPEGFATTKLASEDFQAKQRKEYGDIDGYIRKLDEHASGLFGAGFAYIGIFLNFGLLLSICIYVVTQLIAWDVPPSVAKMIGLSFPLAIVVISIASGFLSLASLREKEWVKRIHFPLTKVMNRLMFLLFSRYITTTLGIASSNAIKEKDQSTRAVLTSIFSFFAFMAFMGFVISSSGLIRPLMIDKVYFRWAGNPNLIEAERYADQEFDGIYAAPVISSIEQPLNGPLDVWVPLPARENTRLLNQCSVPEVDEELPSVLRRQARSKRHLTCAREYVSLFLNDVPVTDYSMLQESRENESGSQRGVRIRIQEPEIRVGENLIKVVTGVPNPEDDEEPAMREAYVPFFGQE